METKDTVMKYDPIYFRGFGIHMNSDLKKQIFKDIAEAQAKLTAGQLVAEITCDKEDVHIFDTSYGYNLVRIDNVFINEDSIFWQELQKELKK